MKALSVRYEVVKADGNWGNTRVGVEVQVEEGETAQQVLESARIFVQHNLPDPGLARRVEVAQRVLADPDNHTMREIKQAQEVIDGLATQGDIGF